MTVTVAVPAIVLRGTAIMDHSRDWSIVDEALLLALSLGGSMSVAALVQRSQLRHQIVVASLARLMRFRLVEVQVANAEAAFAASAAGAELVRSGSLLPRFPREAPYRFSFVVEQYSGCYFTAGEVRLARRVGLEEDRAGGADVRIVVLEAGTTTPTHEPSISRLIELLERGGARRLVRPESRTIVRRDDLLACFSVTDGTPRNLPAGAGDELRVMLSRSAAGEAGTRPRSVSPVGQLPSGAGTRSGRTVSCTFDSADVIVGGTAQRDMLQAVLRGACRHVVLHSTFLDADRYDAMADQLRVACLRGVLIDVLWGADEKGEEPLRKNQRAALEIAAKVEADPVLKRRVRMRLGSTGSHAKLIIADDGKDGCFAVVSSCNWLYSPFGATELSVVLRHPEVVAGVMDIIGAMLNRIALSDDLVTRLHLDARDLRRAAASAPCEGTARVRLLVGQSHESVMREASGRASQQLVVGSNRLGSTAWSGALLPGEQAAARPGVRAVVLYRNTSGPLKRRHEKAIKEEAASKGVEVLRTDKVPLHGKFVLWDDDDLVVTSLNWASASTDDSFPAGEVGVHVHAPGLAQDVLVRLHGISPELPLGGSDSRTLQLNRAGSNQE